MTKFRGAVANSRIAVASRVRAVAIFMPTVANERSNVASHLHIVAFATHPVANATATAQPKIQTSTTPN